MLWRIYDPGIRFAFFSFRYCDAVFWVRFVFLLFRGIRFHVGSAAAIQIYISRIMFDGFPFGSSSSLLPSRPTVLSCTLLLVHSLALSLNTLVFSLNIPFGQIFVCVCVFQEIFESRFLPVLFNFVMLQFVARLCCIHLFTISVVRFCSGFVLICVFSA